MAQTVEEAMPDFDIDGLKQGRTMLLVALVGAALAMPLMVSGKALTFGMLCWVVGLIGGIAGINQIGRAMKISSLEKIVGLLSILMPVLNFLGLGYFFVKANNAIKEQLAANVRDQLRQRSEEKQRKAPQGVESKVKQPTVGISQAAINSKERIGKAIAQIKIAGLSDIPEGQRLEATIKHQGISPSKADEPVILAQKGAFAVAYLIDDGAGFSYVNMGEVSAAGITLDELHKIGLKNLAALVNKRERALTLKPLKNSYGLILEGNFEASLVLLDELWDGPLKKFLPNAPVVTLASRDICVFCDAKSPEGLAELKGISDRVTDGGQHLLSSELFIRSNGKWKTFEGVM